MRGGRGAAGPGLRLFCSAAPRAELLRRGTATLSAGTERVEWLLSVRLVCCVWRKNRAVYNDAWNARLKFAGISGPALPEQDAQTQVQAAFGMPSCQKGPGDNGEWT